MVDATNIEQIFGNNIAQIPLENHTKIAVALSGGPDSLALLIMTHRWLKDQKKQVIALIVDHNLRQEAKEEIKQTIATIAPLGIEYYVLTVRDAYSKNILAFAREQRYKLLTEKCHDLGIKNLFIGHTQNDVAETFLMRSFRGAGIDGLAQITQLSYLNNIAIIRPILSIQKIQLQEYLHSQNIKWVNDPSNNKLEFQRIKIRQELNNDQQTIKNIALAAKNLRKAKYIQDKLIQNHIKQYLKIHDLGFITIKMDHNLIQEQEIFEILVLKSIQFIGQNEYKLKNKSFVQLINKILITQKTLSYGNCLIFNKDGYLHFVREMNKEQYKDIANNNLWDRRFIIHDQLDKGRYIDKVDLQKLNKQQCNFVEDYHQIDKRIILSLPAIYLLENLVAIPNICYNRQYYAKLPQLEFICGKELPNTLLRDYYN